MQPSFAQGRCNTQVGIMIKERTAVASRLTNSGAAQTTPPAPTAYITDESCLQRPLLKEEPIHGGQPCLSSLPDTVLSIVVQHLDTQTQLHLSYTCRALAQAFFRCQLKPARLMLHDPRFKWEGLLSSLTWLPISSMSLGWTGWDGEQDDLVTTPSTSEGVLDSFLGISEDSILNSEFVSQAGLKVSEAVSLWNRNFSGFLWRPSLRYDSVVSVTLKGMRLAFVVPPALAHACPNLQQLTLKSCKIYGMVEPNSTSDNPASLTVSPRDGYAQLLVQQLVAGTVCSSLRELNLIDTCPASHPDWYGAPSTTLQAKCLACNLPGLRKLSMVRSQSFAPELIHSCGSRLESLSVISLGTSEAQVQHLDDLRIIVHHCSQLQTLHLPQASIPDFAFKLLLEMPALRHLSAYNLHLRTEYDFSGSNGLENLTLINNMFHLTTLGRLPLRLLQNDPISKRPELQIQLLDTCITTFELSKALLNLQGSCSNGIAAQCLDVQSLDVKEEIIAQTLMQLLSTLKPKNELRLSWARINANMLGGLQTCTSITSLGINRCKFDISYREFWSGILQCFPFVCQLTIQHFTAYLFSSEATDILQSALAALAAVNHKEPIKIIVGPTTVDVDVDVVRRRIRCHLPLKLYLGDTASFEGDERSFADAMGDPIVDFVPSMLPALVMIMAKS